VHPDLTKVRRISEEFLADDSAADLRALLAEARIYLLYYDWCADILDQYIGIFIDGIVGIYLFRIVPGRPEVDDWIWVVVGDLPPDYLTVDQCPNPASALDGYIGAMNAWVAAASAGESVAQLTPSTCPQQERTRTAFGGAWSSWIPEYYLSTKRT
jgi:hypothetical protein